MSIPRKQVTLISSLLVLSPFLVLSALLSPVYATGVVCIADHSSTPDSCPPSPVNFNGPTGTDLSVAVNVQASDSFNGFDITVITDPSVLQPTATDLTGTVFPPDMRTVLTNEVDPIRGFVRAAVVKFGPLTPAPTTGNLFVITYHIVSQGGSSIFFPTGCPGSSNDSFCVTLTNPNLPGGAVPLSLQTASFGTVTPDFTVSASPSSQALFPGEARKSTIFLASLEGFSGTVDLTTSPPPLCPACPGWSVDPTSVQLTPDGSATAALTFITVPSTPPASYTVTVTGTSGNLAHSVDVVFVVVAPPPPGFGIAVDPTSLTIVAGDSANVRIAVISISGFEGNVALSATVSPEGPVATVDPQTVFLPASGVAGSKLTVSTTNATPLGSYSVIVTGTSGSITRSASVDVTVAARPPPPLVGVVCIALGDMASCPTEPASFTVDVGSRLSVSVNIQESNALNGFDIRVLSDPSVLQPVSTSIDGTVLQNPVVIVNVADATSGVVRVAAVSLGFITTAPTTGRFFTITYKVVGPNSGSTIMLSDVKVTNPNLPGGSVPVTLQQASVTARDFTINASSLSLALSRGETVSTTISLGSLNGFSGDVTLFAFLSPASTTPVRRLPSVSLDPSAASLAPGGEAFSTLTVSAPRSAMPGTYSVTVTATTGSITHSLTITVTVLPRH